MEPAVRSDERGDGPVSVDGGLSEDRVFSLLAAARRRAVLRQLRDGGGELPLSEVTHRVAVDEGTSADAEAGEFKAVYVSLYQTHVPALEAAGVVEYDREDKVVRLTPSAAPLFAYLEVNREGGNEEAGGLLSRLFRQRPP